MKVNWNILLDLAQIDIMNQKWIPNNTDQWPQLTDNLVEIIVINEIIYSSNKIYLEPNFCFVKSVGQSTVRHRKSNSNNYPTNWATEYDVQLS